MALRAVGRQLLVPLTRRVSCCRGMGLWRPWWWDQGWCPSDAFRNMERELRRFEREMDRSFRDFGVPSLWHMQPFHHYEEPVIVEEDGKQKMKMILDVSRFKPEEVNVKTHGKTLTIEARHYHKDANGESKFQFSRDYTLPDGVKPEDVTCKYLADGRLTLEAPCKAPAAPAIADKDIPVTHE